MRDKGSSGFADSLRDRYGEDNSCELSALRREVMSGEDGYDLHVLAFVRAMGTAVWVWAGRKRDIQAEAKRDRRSRCTVA